MSLVLFALVIPFTSLFSGLDSFQFGGVDSYIRVGYRTAFQLPCSIGMMEDQLCRSIDFVADRFFQEFERSGGAQEVGSSFRTQLRRRGSFGKLDFLGLDDVYDRSLASD